MNYKRKSRRRFFLLVQSRTPPISSEFRGGGGLNTPNHPPTLGTPLTELSVICTIAGQSVKPTRQTRGLNPNRRKQSRKVETVALKLVITIGRHPEHRGSRKPRQTLAFGHMKERRFVCGAYRTCWSSRPNEHRMQPSPKPHVSAPCQVRDTPKVIEGTSGRPGVWPHEDAPLWNKTARAALWWHSAQTLSRCLSLPKYHVAQKCTILRVPIFMKLEMLHSILFRSLTADFTQTRQ